ncbi:MAG: HD domain-containing protein [Clostridia bacterium]|nr:HD domain-containing protein [Clostridia bacterium]
MVKFIESEIPPKIVKLLRSYCYSLAENSDDFEFESSHMRSVEKNIIELAIARNLDINTSILIALLHDIGRIKNDIFGKGHAEEGAAEAEILLKKYDIPQKTRKTIVKAIYNHNKKKKIHDEYSELIKDADSMSRYRGIPVYEGESPEYIRNKYSRIGKCIISNKDGVDITGILTGKIRELKNNIRNMAEKAITPKLIHEVRIEIRSIRSIIWYIKKNVKSNCRTSIEALDEELRTIFKDYEMPRKIHVFRKKLKDEFPDVALVDYLKGVRKSEHKKARKIIKNSHKNQIDAICERVEFLIPSCEIKNLKKLPENINFKKAMKSADAYDIETLHRLRILCKKVMYLNTMGIIGFSQPDFIDLLKNLHKNIGLLNDRIENVNMLGEIRENNKHLLTDDLFEAMVRYLEMDDGLEETVKRNIFELHLRT